ncbi:MAG: Ditrans,polycis-undecaprenyl-diphosphate synthase ((2E,6E)-farnesyl-diphosphate specific) [Firmicutes bacterium]|nr:Ditrans,polycis-undecaprenyl-diphosphate synthase ((2E,6E)-farnesyl-diphosphate specific) [Bacillota bacterium]
MQRDKKFKRLPKHIGIIPDGNRRWAVKNGMQKQEGYQRGLAPGLLLEYVQRRPFGKGLMNINFLVNYGWQWDLAHLAGAGNSRIASHDIPRIDLIVRWGGRSRRGRRYVAGLQTGAFA